MVHLHSRIIHDKSRLLQQTTGADDSGIYTHHDFILDNENNTAYGAYKLNPTDTVSSDVGLATLGSHGPCGGDVDYKAGVGQYGQRPVADGTIVLIPQCKNITLSNSCIRILILIIPKFYHLFPVICPPP